MKGNSETTHKLNNDKTECFIQWFMNLQGHLSFESNRNSCGSCSYQIQDSSNSVQEICACTVPSGLSAVLHATIQSA